MNGFDRQRLMTALVLLVTALFVASGRPQAARWRQRLRRAAIVAFVFAAAVVVGEIALWLAGWPAGFAG
ncbi:MAG: hypothetical protein ACM3JG_06825 [Thiohalocapsa sp.]